MRGAGDIPDTWGANLSEPQLEAYLGMDIRTITQICPVQPLDFGKRIVLYRRKDIDAWNDSIKTRLPKTQTAVNDSTPAPEPAAAPAPDDFQSQAQVSLDRVRERIGNTRRCPAKR